MDNNNTSEVLKHYGILGMRWGVRKRGSVSSKSTSKGASNNSNNTGNRRMTNKELKARINRLRLEQDYANLTKVPEKQTVSNVTKIVAAAGTVATLSKHASTIYKSMNELGLISKTSKG